MAFFNMVPLGMIEGYSRRKQELLKPSKESSYHPKQEIS
jgi:hypothetical protein